MSEDDEVCAIRAAIFESGNLARNRKARLACKVLYTTLTAHTAQALHPWRCQRDGGGLARTRHPTDSSDAQYEQRPASSGGSLVLSYPPSLLANYL